jgi:regulator of cell morphogenesis and NO signaling
MNIQKESKIGEVVADNFRTAQVFESLGIDFCCGGKNSINDACMAKGIDPDFVVKEISKAGDVNSTASHFSTWDVDFLIDYIVNNHHSYVLTSLPTIEHHLQKVIAAHGEKNPNLAEIDTVFSLLKAELIEHMMKEERMLFPYIKKLNFCYKNSIEIPAAPFGALSNPVRVMEDEHAAAGEMMAQINKLTGGYLIPEKACGTYKLLYNELKDFETDLHMHVHLENYILFPKAVELEEKLKNSGYKVL